MGGKDSHELQGVRGLHRNPAAGRLAATLLTGDIKAAAEAVFRQEGGRIIATLIRISGSFDRAEEALQEAFASALGAWSEKGIPQNPAAWITAAAHRKLIDESRRQRTKLAKEDSLRYETRTTYSPADLTGDDPSICVFRTNGYASFSRAATPR